MLVATCVVRCARRCATLREISAVAAPCWSTAIEIAPAISEIRPWWPPISLIAATDSSVADCIPAICAPILVGRLGGLRRQQLHFRGDHRKTLAGLARARRLDGGVERQQIRLLGDRGDQLDHVADPGRPLRQPR